MGDAPHGEMPTALAVYKMFFTLKKPLKRLQACEIELISTTKVVG